MSTIPRYLLEVIPQGNGLALDLGGGRGGMREPLRRLGYQYINLDIQRFDNGEPTVIGSAHALPFRDATFDLVVSKDSLEHFLDPWTAVREVYRILKPKGLFIVWVPFMHPFHGDDTYRYTPLGLRNLFKDFTILYFDSPLWIFTVLGTALVGLLNRMKMGWMGPFVRRVCAWIDFRFTKRSKRPLSFAAAYRLVLQKNV